MFSLGLVWNNWGPGLVADLLGMLSPVVDLDVVFSRGPKHGLSGAGGGAGEISVGKVRRLFYGKRRGKRKELGEGGGGAVLICDVDVDAIHASGVKMMVIGV